MLGQTSAKVTLDTYADLFDEDLNAVVVTLGSRYSRERVAKMWWPRAFRIWKLEMMSRVGECR
jgi:hypothetical protein